MKNWLESEARLDKLNAFLAVASRKTPNPNEYLVQVAALLRL